MTNKKLLWYTMPQPRLSILILKFLSSNAVLFKGSLCEVARFFRRGHEARTISIYIEQFSTCGSHPLSDGVISEISYQKFIL